MNMDETFDFSKNYFLENEVALLRPLEQDDFTHLLPFALEQPELWKFSLISAAGEEGLKDYIKQATEARSEAKEYPFIVFDKREIKYAGSTRFYDIQVAYKTLQLGYTWYGKEFQRTGLNKHCKFLLLSFAFEQAGMERVEFRADNNNERSIAAMKSLGCKVDGILRSNMPTRESRRRDSIVLSILKHEWFSDVKTKLKQKLV